MVGRGMRIVTWIAIAGGVIALVASVIFTLIDAHSMIFQPIVLALMGCGTIVAGTSTFIRPQYPKLANGLLLLNIGCYISAIAIVFTNLLTLQR